MEEKDSFYWLDWHWISDYFKTGGFDDFERPYIKPLLWIVPLFLILRFIYFYFFAGKLSVAKVKSNFRWDPTVILGIIPPILFLLAIELILMALSGPQRTNETSEQWTEGIDITIAIDISQSMEGMDFKPNRLEAAKRIATNFVDGRKGDRIGIVEFRGEAFSRCPITSDYDLVKSQIDEINFGDIAAEGTAIGSALATAVSRMREQDTKSKIIILLSDGEQTAGNIEAETAAKLAQSFGMKIYAIGMGKEGEVPYKVDVQNPFTGQVFEQVRNMKNNFNEAEMKKIAKVSEGQYFRATSNNSLKTIFNKIDKMEKNEIKEDRFKSTKDFYEPYLILGIIFFLLWLFTKSTFLTSALHD